METVNILDRKLAAIETSQTDSDCFKHIHGYIKYILETPELKAILDAEEKDFYKKVKFTNDNIKLEQANFYQAYFVASYVRIYLPIEHYWNSSESDEKQDPVALLLIWGPKHPRTIKWVNGHEFFSKKERLKQLKSYWQWFDGQRSFYIGEIKNLHLALITELSKKQTLPMIVDEKPDVFQMDLETGDFNLGGVTGTLNTTTQEFRVMAKLYTAPSHRVTYLELVRCLKANATEASKTDKRMLGTVIRNIKRQLGILPEDKRVNQDIFRNEMKYGYRLEIKG